MSRDTDMRKQRACLGSSRKVFRMEKKGELTGKKGEPNIIEGPLDVLYVLGVLCTHFAYYPCNEQGRLRLRLWFSMESVPLPLCGSAGM